MKKAIKISFLFLCIIILSGKSVSAQKVTAIPSPQNVSLDGESVSVSAYLINGNNYFKIRDLAAILKNTGSKFNVAYVKAENAVEIESGGIYEGDSNDLKALPKSRQTGIKSPQNLLLNGKKLNVLAYLINGNNYFKLRDLSDNLGFDVDYNDVTKTVEINSNSVAEEFAPETRKLHAFPMEGFQVRSYLYNIRFVVGNNVSAGINYDAFTGKITLLTENGENLQLGNLLVYVRQGEGTPKELKVTNTGVLEHSELEEKGINFNDSYAIIFFLKNSADGKLIPLLILEH